MEKARPPAPSARPASAGCVQDSTFPGFLGLASAIATVENPGLATAPAANGQNNHENDCPLRQVRT